jgi:hypothetical protein
MPYIYIIVIEWEVEMVSEKITVTINKWVLDTMIGDSKNRSSRVEELLIKGYMAEKGINSPALSSTTKGT